MTTTTSPETTSPHSLDTEYRRRRNSTAESGAARNPDALERICTRRSHVSSDNLLKPPDGGLQAWTQVAMGWIVIFTTWGYVNSFGSFQAYYTSVLPQSSFDISWIGSLQVWLTFFGSAFSGRLLDAGLFVPMFLLGSALQLLGIFLMSVSKTYWQLMLTQGVLTGIGGGIIFAPSLALVAIYFQERRGIAIGLVTTGNSLGGVVYPLVLASFGREALGMTYSNASLLTTIINGTGLPARILVPILADTIGPLNTIAPAGLCVAVVAYSWLAIKDVTGIWVFAAFYGIASGAFQSLMPTGVASITKRLDSMGTRIGMCFSIVSFAGLTGPPIGGLIQSASDDNYTGAHGDESRMATMGQMLMSELVLGLAVVASGGGAWQSSQPSFDW
ncbi:monocarboxylate transporter 4 [Fusarium albosuccineum]|uniref:Monocarboxylate transporter 4 n=1 Tax=Fusarium albosuccineum TaxID=1237068 RepID=A0A8H4P770_9HYPO|nr:monocarboxylate transporter 4 [Fusarium albosuccineum]